jgi:hypothetical protein
VRGRRETSRVPVSVPLSCPASTVLRASPPPQAARPIPRRCPVEGHAPSLPGASRVALHLHVPACRRHYPGGPLGSDCSWFGLFQPRPSSPATAAFPMLVQGRRPHWTFRGLLDVHCALSACGGSACCVAKATHLSRRLRRFCHLHRRSDSFWLERPSCHAGLTPAEDQHLDTAHTSRVPVSGHDRRFTLSRSRFQLSAAGLCMLSFVVIGGPVITSQNCRHSLGLSTLTVCSPMTSAYGLPHSPQAQSAASLTFRVGSFQRLSGFGRIASGRLDGPSPR